MWKKQAYVIRRLITENEFHFHIVTCFNKKTEVKLESRKRPDDDDKISLLKATLYNINVILIYKQCWYL